MKLNHDQFLKIIDKLSHIEDILNSNNHKKFLELESKIIKGNYTIVFEEKYCIKYKKEKIEEIAEIEIYLLARIYRNNNFLEMVTENKKYPEKLMEEVALRIKYHEEDFKNGQEKLKEFSDLLEKYLSKPENYNN
jgi:hypothetical protein